ncbi:hypothetical protein [Leptolyngbya sp. FACHB-1624]
MSFTIAQCGSCAVRGSDKRFYHQHSTTFLRLLVYQASRNASPQFY